MTQKLRTMVQCGVHCITTLRAQYDPNYGHGS
jgi:hypothetical protein